MATEISNISEGTPILVMTFGMHFCGLFAGSHGGEVLLSDVRLISEIGPMVPFTSGTAVNGQNGHHSEPIYETADSPLGSVPLDVIQFHCPIVALPKR